MQPAAQVVVAELAAERLGEDVAGEPPLGLADRALAHHLERDDHRRLAGEQSLEVADRAAATGERRASARGCRCRRAGPAPRPPGPPASRARSTNIACRPASARSLTSARMSDAARCEKPRSCGWRASSTPRSSNSIAAPRDRVGDRPHDLGKPALGEDQALEQRVDLDAALERLIALVDQPRRRPLGDRDERQLEGQLEQRQPARLGLVDQRRRQLGVIEADREPEPGGVLAREQAARTCAGGRPSSG